MEPLDRSNKIGQFDAILGLKEELYRTRAQKRWLIYKIMTESVGRVNYRADACTIEDKFVLRYRNKCAFMFWITYVITPRQVGGKPYVSIVNLL